MAFLQAAISNVILAGSATWIKGDIMTGKIKVFRCRECDTVFGAVTKGLQFVTNCPFCGWRGVNLLYILEPDRNKKVTKPDNYIVAINKLTGNLL